MNNMDNQLDDVNINNEEKDIFKKIIFEIHEFNNLFLFLLNKYYINKL